MAPVCPLPFVRLPGDLVLVPFVPARLSSAVLLQDALRWLDGQQPLGLDAVIAVQLPLSIRTAYDEALSHLPTVSVVVRRAQDGKVHEAWPVTPCDARVEALRSAQERSLNVAYIDQEGEAPHRWASGATWPPPSGWIAVTHGVDTWLSQFPNGDEDDETLRRSRHIARELGRLQARFRRVIAVVRIDVCRRLLRELDRVFADVSSDAPAKPFQYTIEAPSVVRVVRLLDEFPRLIERWDRSLRRGGGTPGLHRNDLLQAEIRYYDQHHGPRQALRRYGVWRRMLAAWGNRTGHRAVTRDDLALLGDACFGRWFMNGLRRHLLGYYDQVDPLQVAPDGDVAERSPVDAEELSADGEKNGRESCSLHHSFLWPPWKHLHDELRRRAAALLRGGVRDVSSTPYTGSLEDGIDVRRWLRELASGRRTLYVRRLRYRWGRVPTDGWDPIVWLFEGEEQEPGPHSQRTLLLWAQGRAAGRYSAARIVARPGRPRFKDRGAGRSAVLYRCQGVVSFAPARVSEVEARATLGEDFEHRIPTVDSFWRHQDRDRPLLDRLLRMALPPARTRVLCVLPDGCTPSEEVAEEAANAQVELCVLRHSALGASDVRKLSHYLAVDGKGHPYDQPESPANWIIERYRDVMNEIWP